MSTQGGRVLPVNKTRKQKIASHSKSRHQRIKCDQTLPGCLRCKQKNVECPGYRKAVKWSIKYEIDTRRSADSNGPGWFAEAAEQASAALFQTSTQDESEPKVASTEEIYPTVGERACGPDSSPDDLWAPVAHSIYDTSPSQFSDHCSSESAASENCSEPAWEHQLDGMTCASVETIDQLSPDNFEEAHGRSPSNQTALVTYRDPLPRLTESYLVDESTMLLQYYLTIVCDINCCFDSAKNPFRTDVINLMFDCPLLYHSILSMSAAHMSGKRLEIVPKALQHQSDAMQNLRDAVSRMSAEAVVVEGPFSSKALSPTLKSGSVLKALLASIILGMTSSWHTPSSLGSSHIGGARALFKLWCSEKLGVARDSVHSLYKDPDSSFVVGAMSYWEAMISFLTDQEPEVLDYLAPFTGDGTTEIFPNPWTGLSTQLFILVAMTGMLVRRKRLAVRTVAAIRSLAMRTMVLAELESEARVIEAKLHDYQAPALEDVHDTEDENTPIAHFLVMTKTYRLAALLELYRAFPPLATNRGHSSARQRDLVGEDHNASYRQFILDLAIAILTLLGSIPQGSGITSSQMFPTLVAAAALRSNSSAPGHAIRQSLKLELSEILRPPAVINMWRDAVRLRLTHFCRYIGLPLLNNFVKIIEEVWSRSDSEASIQRDTAQAALSIPHHWLDVMSELRLETILG